jgi:hypothetical protein
LLRARSSYCQREHHRQDRYPDHHPPSGHSARRISPINLTIYCRCPALAQVNFG